MTLTEALLLGLVQGLTEFFPVSSSGHLVLAESLLGVNPAGVTFEVLLHAATLAAVLVVYRRRVLELTLGCVRRQVTALRYVGKLAVASIPAGLIGIGASGVISKLFDAPAFTAVALLVTGTVVYATRWLVDRGTRPQPDWPGTLVIGVAQAAAILPGISRSGCTVAAALWSRQGRESAAEFSFLLSVPAILGASLLEAPALLSLNHDAAPTALVAAALAAFIAGIAAIVLFVRWLRAGRFHRFAYYCWAVGSLYLAVTLFWPR